MPDADGQETGLLVLCAGFAVGKTGALAPLEPQPSVRLADEPAAAREHASTRFEADVALAKPRVDIIVVGSAIAPLGRPVRELEVELGVGTLRKKLLVLGDRQRLLGGVHTRPEPFKRMPIVYERAYGGSDLRARNPRRHKIFAQNPVGVGFHGVASADPEVKSDLPNVERAVSHSTKVSDGPAGFGVIGRSWSPRRELAGTYDDAWVRTQWPLPPRDFDPRHNQCAPPDQQSRTLRGGEDVRLVHMTLEREWRFLLPRLDVPVRLHFASRLETKQLEIDTVVIDADDRRVFVSARLAFALTRTDPLREIVLGHVTSGWLRARARSKLYRGPGPRPGTDRARPAFR